MSVFKNKVEHVRVGVMHGREGRERISPLHSASTEQQVVNVDKNDRLSGYI